MLVYLSHVRIPGCENSIQIEISCIFGSRVSRGWAPRGGGRRARVGFHSGFSSVVISTYDVTGEDGTRAFSIDPDPDCHQQALSARSGLGNEYHPPCRLPNQYTNPPTPGTTFHLVFFRIARIRLRCISTRSKSGRGYFATEKSCTWAGRVYSCRDIRSAGPGCRSRGVGWR